MADRLGLSEEVRGRLRQLVNEREDAALEIVLSIKDLPPMEQTARLTPFVAESERLGFALLTVAATGETAADAAGSRGHERIGRARLV